MLETRSALARKGKGVRHGGTQLCRIDACHKSCVSQVLHQPFRGQIAGRPWRIRASAKTTDGAVEAAHAKLQRHVDIRQRLAGRIVEMAGQPTDGNGLDHLRQHHVYPLGSGTADRIGHGDFSAADLQQSF